MDLPPPSFLLALVGADYTKRLSDQHVWDRLMATPLGNELRRMSPRGKLTVEAGMFLANAILRWNLREGTPWAIYLQEVLGDAAPEIAKRMRGTEPLLNRTTGTMDEIAAWLDKKAL